MEAGEEEDTRENVEEEEEDTRENVEEEEEEEEEKEEESVQETTLEQLQSEVKELRGQLAELETEKEALMKKTRSLEDQQVKNWKWIQDATKFSGISVEKCSAKACTFQFHPMYKSINYQAYAMKVKFTEKGYEIGKCYLPESIDLSDLDNTKPLDRLVWDVSIMVDSFVNRQQQIKELEKEFEDNADRTITFTEDTLKVMLRVRVSDDSNATFFLCIQLNYLADLILPNDVSLEFEGKKDFTDEDMEEFEIHCNPFFNLPLLTAFREAF